ncbi:MAG: N-acetylmuramoyl-L-alanine amidase [Myxococcales bacterium]|nr:N-acetylmuramoyl-L-alanine amidase [Deltaproteobacteria bacterium]NND30218.1 N-acetylmuramoyl-L-alanine amidase [Myxococcales bacterium]MBT8480672.1 N-acetylmuramoyl-L-alanine amidase [Deltaproteobacteria bacterium]NNK08298.1 N-acetylmuramoyl-L-alanine amidase [Myxococcales bacterium]NNK44417.1 N-acetylmuramoyl-L-alanine amidase [Myxococcales bacterium]
MFGLVVAAAACRSDPSPRRQQELSSPMMESTEPRNPRVETARLQRIDVYGAGTENAAGARVVLLFEGVPLFEQKQLPAEGILPPRIAIELQGAEWDASVPVSQAIGRGGLQRVRLATPNPRVVLDLHPTATGRVFFLTDPYRIVVDVSAAPPSRNERRPLVVLDPGHGGREPGAANDRYALVESQLALELAELTATRLRAIMPRSRVLLTRSGDVGLSLEERCALANAMEADVFVSIHLNASSEEVRKGGVTTFVLDTTNNRQALRLAARENGTRVAEVTGIQSLLAKHHRQSQAEGSLTLAGRIQRSTLKAGRRVLPSLSDRGVRRAMFYVLVGARMPSVLLEASFLTYEPEARALTKHRYRRALADGIASGIASYLQTR